MQDSFIGPMRAEGNLKALMPTAEAERLDSQTAWMPCLLANLQIATATR
jgi:hypothetical protein